MELDLGGSALDTLSSAPIKAVDFNVSDLAVLQVGEETEVTALSDPAYEQFLADVWVGIVLTLMVLSCVCFMCSCLIYHKFQEWKQRVDNSGTSNVEAGMSEAELPSYTIASGLPTYEEALEQLKKVKELQHNNVPEYSKPNVSAQESSESRTPVRHDGQSGLSVFSLFGIYNKSGESAATKPA